MMSAKDIGLSSAVHQDQQRALDHLRLAQELIDKLDRPEVGARLQEIIDAMNDGPPPWPTSSDPGDNPPD